MANIVESNSCIDIQSPNGDIIRIFPFTKIENVIGAKNLISVQTKALKLLAVNSYIVDDVTGKTYKIGISNGKAYFEESDVSVKDLLDNIVDVIDPPKPPGSGEEPDPPDNPGTTVDKTNLDTVITTATTNLNDSTNLSTNEMKTILNSAITSAQGVYNNENASQEDVDNAVSSLQDATTTFLSESANIITSRSHLNTTITEAKTKISSGDYTPNSVSGIQLIVTESEEMYNNSTIQTAQVYSEQATKLQGEIAKLVLKANKTILSEKINAANNTIDDTTKLCTTDMKSVFSNAISTAQGVFDDDNATQTEVDNQVSAIETATSVFTSKSSEIILARNELNAKITEINNMTDLDHYTTSSVNALHTVTSEATELYNNVTIYDASVYTDKKKALNVALNNLTERQDVSGLSNLYNEANTNYNNSNLLVTELTKSSLATALSEANTVIENGDATQDDIDEALTKLTAANNEFLAEAEEISDAKNALNTAITNGKTYVNKTNKYTPNSIAVLQNKLTEAQTLYDNTTVQLASTYTTKKNEIQSAINALVNQADKVELNNSIVSVQDDIDNEEYEITANTLTLLTSALTNAQNVNNDANATQLQVDEVNAILNEAREKCINEHYDIQTAKQSLTSTITTANQELSKTDTYTAASFSALQTKTTEAQTLLNDTTIHPASDYTTKNTELQSAIDGLYNLVLLKAGIDAATNTKNHSYNDALAKSDSFIKDTNFYNIFGKHKADCQNLIDDLDSAYENADRIYYNHMNPDGPLKTPSLNLTEIFDENDSSLVFTLAKRNLLTMIDKAERKLVGYTGGLGDSWYEDGKTVCQTAVAKGKEVIDRPSEDISEYISVATDIYTASCNLKTKPIEF